MRSNRSMGISRALVLVLGGLLAASSSLARDRDHDDDHGRGHDRDHGRDHDRDHCDDDDKDHGKRHDQDDCDDDDKELSRERIARMLEEALPPWSEDVLDVPPDKAWAEEVTFDRLLTALGDDDPLPGTVPEGARQVREDERTMRLDPEHGQFRYINRRRSWSFDRDFQKPAFAADKSQELVVNALGDLGAPLEELSGPRAELQMGAGAPAGEPRATETFEMYRLVLLSRRLGGLTVYGSEARAAVSHDGRVQRLQVRWPAFSFVTPLRIRSRDDVVTDAVQRIVNQQPRGDTSVEARLVYAPRADRNTVLRFLPAVQIAVRSEPTPYFVMVPVAEETDEDEIVVR